MNLNKKLKQPIKNKTWLWSKKYLFLSSRGFLEDSQRKSKTEIVNKNILKSFQSWILIFYSKFIINNRYKLFHGSKCPLIRKHGQIYGSCIDFVVVVVVVVEWHSYSQMQSSKLSKVRQSSKSWQVIVQGGRVVVVVVVMVVVLDEISGVLIGRRDATSNTKHWKTTNVNNIFLNIIFDENRKFNEDNEWSGFQFIIKCEEYFILCSVSLLKFHF